LAQAWFFLQHAPVMGKRGLRRSRSDPSNPFVAPSGLTAWRPPAPCAGPVWRPNFITRVRQQPHIVYLQDTALLQEVFDVANQDGDGKLDTSEFELVMRALLGDRAVNKHDDVVGGHGKDVTFEEFLLWFQLTFGVLTVEAEANIKAFFRVVTLFREVDMDGSGFIDQEEFEEVLPRVIGVPLENLPENELDEYWMAISPENEDVALAQFLKWYYCSFQRTAQRLREHARAAMVTPDMQSDYNSSLLAACKKRNVGLAKLMLRRHADPNTRDKASWTPLHYAVACNSLELTRELLKCGADTSLTTGGLGLSVDGLVKQYKAKNAEHGLVQRRRCTAAFERLASMAPTPERLATAFAMVDDGDGLLGDSEFANFMTAISTRQAKQNPACRPLTQAEIRDLWAEFGREDVPEARFVVWLDSYLRRDPPKKEIPVVRRKSSSSY